MNIDLNVPYFANSTELRKLVLTLPELKYDGCALNHELRGRITVADACKIEPFDISASKTVVLDGFSVKGIPRAFRQWTRATVHLEDEGQLTALTGPSPVLGTYDLVAARVSSAAGTIANKLFAKCCSSLEVDIISIDLASKLPFHLRPQLVAQAVQRGVHFEITYSAALRDSTARRNLISNALLLVRATRGRNLLLSSEARRAIDARSAHDVANLGSLFGLSASAARQCLSGNARAAIAHGEARRVHGAIMAPMVPIEHMDGAHKEGQAQSEAPKSGKRNRKNKQKDHPMEVS